MSPEEKEHLIDELAAVYGLYAVLSVLCDWCMEEYETSAGTVVEWHERWKILSRTLEELRKAEQS